MRTFVGIGVIAAALVLVLTFLPVFSSWKDIAIGVLALATIYAAGMTLLMIAWSRVVKVRERDAALDRIGWRGDERVLDVGCGRGLLLIGAAERVPRGHATGIDLWRREDQSANDPAATLANATLAGVADRVSVETADMRALPFGDGAFDVVLSHWAVHNLGQADDRTLALGEMARVLRPGGTILLADIANRAEYAATFARLGLRDPRIVASRGRDAVLGAVSFGSFRPFWVGATR